MRILSILPFSPPSPVYGGAELQMHSIHKGLLSRGIEVCVLADISQVNLPFQVFEGVPIWGVPFPVLTAHPLRPGNIRLWQRLHTIYRVVKKKIPPPDLIQACTFRQPAILAYWLAKKLAVPWVARLACSGNYGDFCFCRTNWLLHLLLPRMIKSVAHVIALDAQTRKEAIANGVPDDRVTLIPNGLLRRPDNAQFEKQFSAKLTKILFLGRLSNQKRVEVLLQGVARLNEKDRSAMDLTIIGDGEKKNELQSLANQYGLSDHCSFTGHLVHPEEELVNGDCLVNPSESEGLPNAVLEAAAFGLPLILSDIPIHREIAGAVGMQDYLFQVGDAGELAEKLSAFIRLSPGIKKSYSTKCQAFGKRFLPELRDQAYIALYQKLLKSDRKEIRA